MKESWKLMTTHFVFSAVTLTFVVFIFIHVNIAIEDLNKIIPQIADAVNLVPEMRVSLKEASSRVVFIENKTKYLIPMIEDALVSIDNESLIISDVSNEINNRFDNLTSNYDVLLENTNKEIEIIKKSMGDINLMLEKIYLKISAGNF